jgi:hypothetical protein
MGRHPRWRPVVTARGRRRGSCHEYGTLNDLFTNQTGDGNTIDSWQQDTSNLTVVAQIGSSNHSNTVQSGNANLATVNQ